MVRTRNLLLSKQAALTTAAGPPTLRFQETTLTHSSLAVLTLDVCVV